MVSEDGLRGYPADAGFAQARWLPLGGRLAAAKPAPVPGARRAAGLSLGAKPLRPAGTPVPGTPSTIPDARRTTSVPDLPGGCMCATMTDVHLGRSGDRGVLSCLPVSARVRSRASERPCRRTASIRCYGASPLGDAILASPSCRGRAAPSHGTDITPVAGPNARQGGGGRAKLRYSDVCKPG